MTATAVASDEPQRQPWTWMQPAPATLGCTPTPQVWIVNTVDSTADTTTIDYWSQVNVAAGGRSGAVWVFPGGVR